MNKPPPQAPDPKSGKLAPGQINNNRDLDVDIKKEEPSFFASFFPSVKGQAKKKGPIMEPVSATRRYDEDCTDGVAKSHQ
jgi:dynamin 1-like protein